MSALAVFGICIGITIVILLFVAIAIGLKSVITLVTLIPGMIAEIFVGVQSHEPSRFRTLIFYVATTLFVSIEICIFSSLFYAIYRFYCVLAHLIQ